jgi:phosphatidylglycerophosphatase A
MSSPPAEPARPGQQASTPSRSTFADHVATALATWFGCGLVPKAPGTVGTLGALPLYFLVAPGGPILILIAALAATLVGIWAAGRVARRLATHDPQIVCIDEVAGVLITLAAAPRTTAGVIAGVVVFRALDMLKPWPARWAERRLPGGSGVVLDDVFAGLWGAAGLLAARWAELL